jgi:predicted RNA-binding protein with PUA-like domain
MLKLGEQTKAEPAANEDNLFTHCSLAKIRAESTRYWDGVKQYRSRMLKVPVKRVFSPIA